MMVRTVMPWAMITAEQHTWPAVLVPGNAFTTKQGTSEPCHPPGMCCSVEAWWLPWARRVRFAARRAYPAPRNRASTTAALKAASHGA